MYRVEFLDGRIELMTGEELARYAGLVRAFVLEPGGDDELAATLPPVAEDAA